jgi:hypothetical protein
MKYLGTGKTPIPMMLVDTTYPSGATSPIDIVFLSS